MLALFLWFETSGCNQTQCPSEKGAQRDTAKTYAAANGAKRKREQVVKVGQRHVVDGWILADCHFCVLREFLGTWACMCSVNTVTRMHAVLKKIFEQHSLSLPMQLFAETSRKLPTAPCHNFILTTWNVTIFHTMFCPNRELKKKIGILVHANENESLFWLECRSVLHWKKRAMLHVLLRATLS